MCIAEFLFIIFTSCNIRKPTNSTYFKHFKLKMEIKVKKEKNGTYGVEIMQISLIIIRKQEILTPQFWCHRYGATVSVPTISAREHYNAGTVLFHPFHLAFSAPNFRVQCVTVDTNVDQQHMAHDICSNAGSSSQSCTSIGSTLWLGRVRLDRVTAFTNFGGSGPPFYILSLNSVGMELVETGSPGRTE